MGVQISSTATLAKEALNYRAAREKMIASNIANADTPFYKPRDIEFKDYMIQRKAEVMNTQSDKLELATTDGAHIPLQKSTSESMPTTYFVMVIWLEMMVIVLIWMLRQQR